MQFNLEERTKQFSLEVIRFVREITVTAGNKRIIDQVIGSSSSIGANYREASEAESRKDFFHKIGLNYLRNIFPIKNLNCGCYGKKHESYCLFL